MKNELKKITDAGTIYNLILGARDRNSEVYIWRLVGGQKHVAAVKIESVRKLRADFSIVPREGQDRLVQDLIGSQTQVDLYVPDSALIVRCEIRQTDAPLRYYLSLPSFAAQTDRRSSLRLNVEDLGNVQLNFGRKITLPRPITQHFQKGCYDVSTGGLSFYVSKIESKLFKSGDELKDVDFKAGDWSTKLSLEVTQLLEIEPDEFNGLSYKVWRVCCRYSHIDQISQKYLEKFIFERIKDELHVING